MTGTPPQQEDAFRVLFREDQQCRDPYLWIFLILIASMVGSWALRTFAHEAMGEPRFQHPALAIASLVLLGAIMLPPVLLAVARLQVEVSSHGLFVRFYPLHRKVHQIDLTGVTHVESVTYRPFLEYGGYGLRRLPRATAYNMRGNRGVRLHYQNGYHLLIGTEHPEELLAALKAIR